MKLIRTVLFLVLVFCTGIIQPQTKPVNNVKSDSAKTAEEAFNASAFIPAVKNNSSGEVFIIKGASHDSILKNIEAMQDVKAWAEKYDFISGSK